MPARKMPERAEFTEIAREYDALGDPTRLRLLYRICEAERPGRKGEPVRLATVTALAEAEGLAAPTVSRHVALLVAAGYVVPERQGKFTYFSTDKDICTELRERLQGAGRPKVTL